jgi:hypothetical protein
MGKKPLRRSKDRCGRELHILKKNIVFSYKNVGRFLEKLNCHAPSV